MFVQVMLTLLTAAPAMVPVPLVTAQFWAGELGAVATVTAYGLPLATPVAKVKVPFALTDRLSPPLSFRTSPVPLRPDAVPLTVYLLFKQLTASVIGPPAMVPAGEVTVQVCQGFVGCEKTVTA